MLAKHQERLAMAAYIILQKPASFHILFLRVPAFILEDEKELKRRPPQSLSPKPQLEQRAPKFATGSTCDV